MIEGLAGLHHSLGIEIVKAAADALMRQGSAQQLPCGIKTSVKGPGPGFKFKCVHEQQLDDCKCSLNPLRSQPCSEPAGCW